jgi:hypothetical protein
VFPEPLESDVGIVIGILPLPLIDREFGGRKSGQWVLWGFLLGNIVFLFGLRVLLPGLFLWLLSLLFFLGWGFLFGSYWLEKITILSTGILNLLGNEFRGSPNCQIRLEVTDQSPMSGNIGEL